MNNRLLLLCAAFLRAFATGLMGVALAIHLSKQQLNVSQIGLVISAGLLGAAIASTLTTFFGDRVGRRRLLIALSLLSCAGGIAFSFSTSYLPLLAASCVGMLNGMGRDRGSFLILETAILPSTTSDAKRTWAFAWYTFLQDAGTALGGLCIALASVVSFQTLFLVYSLIFLVMTVIYFGLDQKIELGLSEIKAPVSKEGRVAVTKISLLFLIDAIAGGFLVTALLSHFFYERFSVSVAMIGGLFFVARSLNAVSHFGAAWLSKRIGLVNTMVFTHIPSSLVLMTVVFAPSFPIAAALFLMRESMVEMDVPTRQSYVMAVVKPHERTFASGITNIVRMVGWAIAPAFAGLFMAEFSMATPIFIGASLKIAYDILLYFGFRKIKAPEEYPT